MSAFWEWIINGIIAAAGVIVLFGLMAVQKKLSALKEKSNNIYRQTQGAFRINRNAETFRAGFEVRNDLDPEAMDRIREEFNEVTSSYYSLTQWISLFPLAGLLGTVIGLMPGLRAVQGGDFDLLYTSLSTALTSTLVGLVASIILKIYVAGRPSRTVNDIENNLEENDRKLNYALGFQSFRETPVPDERG
ncbi:MAG: MotA/TolQ/ExbB proton channel family protein [Lachnospiraceae bacterium]|nr:MotA/TolQ/ExbB proton channel family protein [Lachnospiraceae bacterium]